MANIKAIGADTVTGQSKSIEAADELIVSNVGAPDAAVEHYATVLAQYHNLAGKLISYEDALVWVRSVLSSP